VTEKSVKRARLWGALIIVVGVLLSWQTYRFSKTQELENYHQVASEQLLETIRSLRVAVDQFRYLPFLLSQNRDVQRLLLSPDEANHFRVSRYLEQTNLIAGSAALMIMDKHGQVRAFSNWREEASLEPDRYAHASFFKGAQKSEQGPYLVTDPDTRQPAYYLSAPIYANQSFLGVAVLRLKVATLREQLSSELSFYVSDHEGRLLLTSAMFDQSKAWPLVDLTSMAAGDLWVDTLKREGRLWLVNKVKLDDLNWFVGVLIPMDRLQSVALGRALAMAGTLLVLVLLALYLREAQLKRRSQRETMRAHLDSEQRQRKIINTAQVGLITVASDGRIEFINNAVMRLFGVSQALVKDKFLSELFDDIEQFEPLDRWLKMLGHQEFAPISAYEIVGRRADGSTFPMMFSLYPLGQGQSDRYLATIIDISRRKRLEHALREMNESLEQKVVERTEALKATQKELFQSEKMAALGRMSTAVVHELNQPLTAMRNSVSVVHRLVDAGTVDAARVQSSLGFMDQLIERMASMTGQLKSFAYKGREATQKVALTDVVTQIDKQLRPRCESLGVTLKQNAPTPAIYVMGDHQRLEQVLGNLVGNACDALESIEQAEKWISIDMKAFGDRVSVWVSDNGPGVKKEAWDHLFEPFYTTKPIGKGLGLGLSIVDQIVRDLGGQLQVAPNEPQGLVMKVTLPCAVAGQ
jgi:two-component system C4-dicarboxylate transport sensor histidine kinase DctB